MLRTSGGAVLLALVVGGLVGAVAALMVAPAPGPVTRRRLRLAGAKTARQARGAFNRARRAAADQAHRLADALEERRTGLPASAGSREPRWDEEARQGVVSGEPGAA